MNASQSNNPFLPRPQSPPNLPRRSPRLHKTVSIRDAVSPLPNRMQFSPTDHASPSQLSIPHKSTNDVVLETSSSRTCLTPPTIAANPPSPAKELSMSGAVLIDDEQNIDFFTKVYTFLYRLNKTDLRKTCKAWHKRLAGNKPELLYRAFLSAKPFIVEERVTQAIDDNNGCPSFTDFLKNSDMACFDWHTPPFLDNMKTHLVIAGDTLIDNKTQNASDNSPRSGLEQQTPNFTHWEFARLVLVMRDDETARAARLALSQSLARAAQDAGVKRDSYWKTIADRYNDLSLVLNFSFEGDIDDIDVSKPPQCKRSGAFLKEQWQKARTEFTKAQSRWSKSGQNDPEKFPDFLSYNNNQLYSVCKRALIIFVCSGLGTGNIHTLLADSATKEILDGGYEEGINKKDEDVESSQREKKRRKRNSGTIDEEFEDMSKSVKEMGTLVKNLLQDEGNKASQTAAMRRNTAAYEEDALFKRVKETFIEFKWAQENSVSMPKIIDYAQMRHEEAMEAYEELRNSNVSRRMHTA